ncbi:MAG: glycoside hydrolase family 5 protein [Phycisphaerales bacterium]
MRLLPFVLLFGLCGCINACSAESADVRQAPSSSRYSQSLPLPPLDIQSLHGEHYTSHIDAGGTLTLTLTQHTGNDYVQVATVSQPADAPAQDWEYELSYETRFVAQSAGDRGSLGLGMVDARGWNATHSAVAIPGAEKADAWKTIRGAYRPLPDGRGVVILLRLESGSHTVSGTWEIRNLRLVAQSVNEGISPQELALVKKRVIPEQQRRDAPPIARGFNITSLGRWGFTYPTVQYYRDMKAKWGATVVRLPFNPQAIAEDKGEDLWTAWPGVLDMLEQAVKNAEQAGVKVVPVLGGSLGKGIDHKLVEFWNQPDLDATFRRIWKDIAQRLKPYHGAIYGYDIFNEPVDIAQPGPPRQWRPIALNIIQTIRAVDPDVWIIYEPGPWNEPAGYEHLTPIPDPKIIYSVHFYEPTEFTHQGVFDIKDAPMTEVAGRINMRYPGMIAGQLWDKDRLAARLKPVDDFQAKWGVPIYVGEFSAIRWAPDGSAARWLKDVSDLFNQRRWSWCYHAYREWNGWSLEHDNTFWREGMPYPTPADHETDRGKVIKAALRADMP